MKIIADLHTHTIASGHAFSTVNELAHAAASAGLTALGLADHGPALPGGPHRFHFYAMRFIPRQIAGVRIFRGVEANILDEDGRLDLELPLESLDYALAGLHENCGYCGRDQERNTRAILAAMQNPQVKCITHPGNPMYASDYQAIVRGAIETGTAIEINNSSLWASRKGSLGNCLEIARLCAQTGAPVMIGSDAHFCDGVGMFDEALRLVDQAGIKEEQVVNASYDRLVKFLGVTE